MWSDSIRHMVLAPAVDTSLHIVCDERVGDDW
jgi:hypothetical protein